MDICGMISQFIKDYTILLSTIFSGLGIFLATILVEFLKDKKYKFNLLKYFKSELIYNCNTINISFNPLISYFPLKKVALEQLTENRITYFSEQEDLNGWTMLANNAISNSENSWQFFKDLQLNKIDKEISDQYNEDNIQFFLDINYIFLIFTFYNCVNAIDKILKPKDKFIVITKEWINKVKNISGLISTNWDDMIKNPNIDENMKTFLKLYFKQIENLAKEFETKV
jgi:hypothetical protein